MLKVQQLKAQKAPQSSRWVSRHYDLQFDSSLFPEIKSNNEYNQFLQATYWKTKATSSLYTLRACLCTCAFLRNVKKWHINKIHSKCIATKKQKKKKKKAFLWVLQIHVWCWIFFFFGEILLFMFGAAAREDQSFLFGVAVLHGLKKKNLIDII